MHTPRPIRQAPSIAPETDSSGYSRVWGERLRRLALALTGGLFVARAMWPGESVDEASSIAGTGWIAVALAAVLLEIVGALLSGARRTRWHAVDWAFIAFIALYGFSAGHADDRRIALNIAWEMFGVGLLYLLFRALPQGIAEKRSLMNVLVATAFAIACFGLFQVAVVYPRARQFYRENPAIALREAGVAPDAGSRAAFEQRLLQSREPIGTFSLANSMGGFLVCPLVLLAGAGITSFGRWRRLLVLGLIALPIVVCLLLTKSRTAYVGAFVGLAALAWLQRRALGARGWLVVATVASVAILALVALAYRAGQLDKQVLSEASKSLRYRWEYWVGTWGVLTEGTTWWSGLGPGNFAGAYLRHKLPVASESIKDPHNAWLEIWSSAGLPALIAFCVVIGWALAKLGRARGDEKDEDVDGGSRSAAWVLWCAGVGGILLAMILRPELSPFAGDGNPFANDLDRWLVLIAGWSVAAALLQWFGADSRGLPVAAFAAAGLGFLVNVLGAGGISFAPVAAMFWCTCALGLGGVDRNGTEDERPAVGRYIPVALALIWAALVGTFIGTMVPGWRAHAAITRGESAQLRAREALLATRAANPRAPIVVDAERLAVESYAVAADWFRDATRIDRLSARAWMNWALVELEGWRAKGAPIPEFAWHKIKSQLLMARTAPRDPNSFAVASAEFQVANQLLGDARWPEAERLTLQKDRLDAARRAASLNPTSAGVVADRAYAAEALGEFAEAIAAGKRALELDASTPHRDRKLPEGERARLERRVTFWEQRLAEAPDE